MVTPERIDDLAGMLDDVTRYIRRYVVLSDSQAVACTLWVAHTHAFAAAEATPYLNVTSAVKQCGKTRLLEVLEPIVPAPWLTGRVSAAVLTRKIDGERPTLLLDESDAAFTHRSEYGEALRSILNSGYRRSGRSSLCVGQGAGFAYRDFSTFCSKALAGIGALPDTVTDGRSRSRLSAGRPTSRWPGFGCGTPRGSAHRCGPSWPRGGAGRSKGSETQSPRSRLRWATAPRMCGSRSSPLPTWREATGRGGPATPRRPCPGGCRWTTTRSRSACWRTSITSTRPLGPRTWYTGSWASRTAPGRTGRVDDRSPKPGWPGC